MKCYRVALKTNDRAASRHKHRANCLTASRRFADSVDESAAYGSTELELRERRENVIQQSLCVGNDRLSLALGDVDDIAVVEPIAKPVHVVESTPLLRRPFERMRKALKYRCPMTFRPRETVACGL